MSKIIIENIKELKKLKKDLQNYDNKEDALNYIVNTTKLSKEDCLEIYEFLLDNKNYLEKDSKNKNVFQTISFYCLASLSGVIILPTLGIIAPVFILCAIICPIGGILQLIIEILNFNVSFVAFQLGDFKLNPFLGFILSIIIGIVFYYIGKLCWKILIIYINKIKKINDSL